MRSKENTVATVESPEDRAVKPAPTPGGAELATSSTERKVRMSNMAWIVLIVLAVLFLGGGGFYFRGRR
jgi:hypothetical protein